MTFIKTSKQAEATRLHGSIATHIMLYGGSRSGKTFMTLRNVILRATKVKSNHLVARLFYNSLKKTIIKGTLPDVLKICFPNLQYDLNNTDGYLTLSNGSVIWFGGLDQNNIDKILGAQYSTIYLNEATDISEETLGVVLSRLAENSGLALKMYYDCNPQSKKHWTYTRFIKGETQDGVKIKNCEDRYANLQMNPNDNRQNLPTEYFNTFDEMSAKQKIRFESGEFQDDIEGALWNFDMIVKAKNKPIVELKKVVIAIDPAVTQNEDSDLTGITSCGLDINNEGVILEDVSGKFSPNVWATRAINLYNKHQAAYIVAEVNQGGDMVETIINNIDPNIKVVKVHASKGKFSRAEPVAALYERGLVRHCEGLEDLETEMCEYVPLNSKKSPDRMDSAVYGITDLMIKQKKSVFLA